MEDEICPYATFHLLGFREEMDPSKAMQFQTFPHPGNGHSGTMGPPVGHPTNASAHSRSGSQSMVSELLSVWEILFNFREIPRIIFYLICLEVVTMY